MHQFRSFRKWISGVERYTHPEWNVHPALSCEHQQSFLLRKLILCKINTAHIITGQAHTCTNNHNHFANNQNEIRRKNTCQCWIWRHFPLFAVAVVCESKSIFIFVILVNGNENLMQFLNWTIRADSHVHHFRCHKSEKCLFVSIKKANKQANKQTRILSISSDGVGRKGNGTLANQIKHKYPLNRQCSPMLYFSGGERKNRWII